MIRVTDMSASPSTPPTPEVLPRLGPLFLACPKCGAAFHTEHQASKPMILRPTSPLKEAELSLEHVAKLLPLVFSDTGAYVGKVLEVEKDGTLKLFRAGVEERCPASRFVFFSSRAAPASEPMTLVMMPAWFEKLPQFADQLDYYEVRIRPLLTLLANQKIGEASFLMLTGKHVEKLQQADIRRSAQILKEALETEITKIKVALETLEAQKVLGERSDEEFLLKKSMLSAIYTYLELVVNGITEAARGALKLSKQIKELGDRGSISPKTASEALVITEAFTMADQKRSTSS